MITLFEIVTKGSGDFIFGLLNGIALGRDRDEKVYRGGDYDFKNTHLHKSIAEYLGIGKQYSQFMVPESMIEQATKSLQIFSDDLGYTVETTQEIKGLHFDFSMEIFVRKNGERVLEIIRNREETIRISDFDPEEIVHADAKGAEMYAPEHDYELRGNGRVSGSFSEVLAMYYRLKEVDQVNVTPVEIELAEETAD